jgi:hypothetical protein
MNKLIISISMLSLLSCAGWTDTNEQDFLRQCERNKSSKQFCNCALEKVKTTFSTYDEMINKEKETAKLFVECLEN